jgi:hypothetical protein
MIDDVRGNPVFNHIAGPERTRTLRLSIFVFVLTAVCCLLMVLVVETFYDFRRYAETISGLVALLALLILLFGPQISGVLTALGTAQGVRGEIQPLLLLSGLSDHTVVRGYLLAALYRLLWFWPVSFAVFPALWFAAHHLIAVNACRAGSCLSTLAAGGSATLFVLSALSLLLSLNALSITMALNFILSARGAAQAVIANLFIVGAAQIIGIFFFGLMNYAAPLVITLIAAGASVYLYKDTRRALRRAAEKRLRELP